VGNGHAPDKALPVSRVLYATHGGRNGPVARSPVFEFEGIRREIEVEFVARLRDELLTASTPWSNRCIAMDDARAVLLN
jgi:hypothetical protein